MDATDEKPTQTARKLSEIAAILALQQALHEDPWITGVSDLRDAVTGDIVFAESAAFLDMALRSPASAILTREDLAANAMTTHSVVLVDDPRKAFVRVLELFASPMQAPPGVDSTASIDPTAQVGRDVCVGAFVFVGAGAVLGDGVILMSGVRIGADCVIGAGTIVHPNAVLYPRVKVGRGCILHAGCVLGGDGFGYIQVGREIRKVPHLGSVEIGDGVEIGANTCIDRGKTGATIVGAGTKIDNLVHIAHNVRIGRSCLIIAQVGIAGSVVIGDGVILAGQAGIGDHITIGDGARVGAQGGVIGDVAAGETVSGYPARSHWTKMRELAAATALPEALKTLRALAKRVSRLESGQGTV